MRIVASAVCIFAAIDAFSLAHRSFDPDIKFIAAPLSAFAALMTVLVVLQKQTEDEALIRKLKQATACSGASLVCLAFFGCFGLGLGIQGSESNWVMRGLLAALSSSVGLLAILFLFKAFTLAFEALWKMSGGPPDLLLP